MRALILGGGGANGAWQGAVIWYMYQKGFDFDYVTGVSVGGLHALMVATGQIDQIPKIWLSLEESQVHNKYSDLKVFWRLAVQRKLGAYDNSPLYELLKRYYESPADLIMPIQVGVVNIESGEYLEPDSSVKDFLKYVWASATIPGVWEPVVIGGQKFVDGGVADVSPVSRALLRDPSQVTVINCSPHSPKVYKSKPVKHIINKLVSTINGAVSDNYHGDVSRFLEVNHNVLRGHNHKCPHCGESAPFTLTAVNGRELKYFQGVVIEPDEVVGDSLDFNKKTIAARWQAGIEYAKARFGELS